MNSNTVSQGSHSLLSCPSRVLRHTLKQKAKCSPRRPQSQPHLLGTLSTLPALSSCSSSQPPSPNTAQPLLPCDPVFHAPPHLHWTSRLCSLGQNSCPTAWHHAHKSENIRRGKDLGPRPSFQRRKAEAQGDETLSSLGLAQQAQPDLGGQRFPRFEDWGYYKYTHTVLFSTENGTTLLSNGNISAINKEHPQMIQEQSLIINPSRV